MHNIGVFLKQYIYIILGVICIISVGVVYLISRPATITASSPAIDNHSQIIPYKPEPVIPDVEIPTPEPTIFVVHIVGAVHQPGVYEVFEGARVDDVVRLAGGHTPEADLTLINLAAFVFDAMQIRVPKIGEEVFDTNIQTNPPTSSNNGLVNINTASHAELQTVSGIGTTLATNIINFRETHGNFSSVDELINVNRIGPATLESIRPYVTV